MNEDPGGPVIVHEMQAAAPTELRISSFELFRGQRRIVIVHHGQEYRLHITKGDKLILTK